MVNAVDAERKSVGGRIGVRAGDGDVDVAAVDAGGESTECDLERGAVVRVGDQPVGQPV